MIWKRLVALLTSLLALFGCRTAKHEDVDYQGIAALTEGATKAAQSKHPRGWHWTTAFDEDGNVTGEGWEFRQPPVTHENGLSQLRPLVQKLLQSKKYSVSFSIFAMDDEGGVGLYKTDGSISVWLSFDQAEKEDERKSRALLTGFRLKPKEDYLDDDGIRRIEYELPADENLIVELLSKVALEIEQMKPSEKVRVTFDEEDDTDYGAGAIAFVLTYPIVDDSAPPPNNPGIKIR